MAGSSSSAAVSPPLTKHHVFLNFRGEDTRDNFISHLYAELQRKNIDTYIDYKLPRGEEISPSLDRAIEESMIYVLVFSEDYASSTWCLDELTKILDCKERYGRHVIPVFYKVDPSIVRNQSSETYAEAFVKHEDRFKDNIDKVHAWKAALTEAAGLSGWDSRVTRPESRLIEEIVKDILTKLNRSSISDHQGNIGIVGIAGHIARIQSLMQLESADIRIIGIWGMGGIGKTTIAKQIYHQLALQFNSRNLVLNVREEIERHGIDHIKSKYKLLEEDTSFSNDRLKQRKVLLILDDVKDSRQLEDLIGGRGNFGQGSRIILTTRDMQVLKNAEAGETYEVKGMNFQDSLNLFSIHAFHSNHPSDAYMDLSIEVLHYAKGIPLALQILGSLLYGRTEEEWEDELQKLKKHPDPNIFDVLKQSYDGLDEQQKDIFLDIACFYRSYTEIFVAQKLEDCGFSAKIGMAVLKDRCLISILKDKIEMHDLIQEMGQEIVRQECPDNPGKRSRLWKAEEIIRVLKKNKGTDAVQCILLRIWKKNKVQLHPKAFEKMENLRMCGIDSNVFLPSSLESLPDGLKILLWTGFPQGSLPSNFSPENLVTLDMMNSHLEQLDQEFPNLKRLDLRYSRKLIRIADLYRLSPDIEEILLTGCKRLTEVSSSGFLNKLKCLDLEFCNELRSLIIPSNILWRSLGSINLSDCSKLQMFSIPNITSGRDNGTASESKGILSRVKGTFDPVVNIGRHEKEECWLDLSRCRSLKSLPFEFDLSKLKFLKKLLLNDCCNLETFPEIEDTMENLAELNLEGTAIRALPSSLCRLVALQKLNLRRCTELETIPSSIGNLSKLCELDLAYCESLETFSSSIFKLKLTELNLFGCSKLRTFPEILEPVALQRLNLSHCTKLETIPSSIGNLSKLCELDLTYCTSLETFSSSIFKLKLTKLNLIGCSKLRTFPEILEPAQTFAHVDLTKTAIKELPSSFGNLVQLQTLCLKQCTNLKSLPNIIFNLNLLSVLDCSGCAKLTDIPSDIGRLSLLRKLSLVESGIVNLPESIAHLSCLESLNLSECKKLECIPRLPPFLKQLLAFDCQSITRVMSNSLIQIPSNSKKGGIFRFYFTNGQQLDPGAHANIVDEARLRMTEDAYRSVFFFFPGSEVPHWFPFRGEGHSITINTGSLNFCSDDRLMGFALCLVVQQPDTDDIVGRYNISLSYCLKYESDSGEHILPNDDKFNPEFYFKVENRNLDQDHTFLWKYNLEFSGMSGMSHRLPRARSFTFEISPCYRFDWVPRGRDIKSTFEVKECGICPLYTKEKDDNNVGEGK